MAWSTCVAIPDGAGLPPPSSPRGREGLELESVMEKAFSDELKNKLVFVDVWVDPHEHVYPMAIKGGSMRDMVLSKSAESA